MSKRSLINTTSIPNSLLEAIYVSNSEFNGQEKDLLLYICRKTIGWHKDIEWLTIRRICEDTGKLKGNVSPILQSLLDKGAIVLEEVDGKNCYGLNPDRWGYLIDNGGLSNIEPSSIYIKETNKKGKYVDHRLNDENINRVVEYLIQMYSKEIREARVTTALKDQLKRVLTWFSLDEVIEIIKKKKNDDWFMENAVFRGATWFFESKNRLQKYLEQEFPIKGPLTSAELDKVIAEQNKRG